MLGITVEKGTIIKWFKSEGDQVEKGEIIFEVEADKVTTEVECPASGILKKILIPEGVEVPLLTLVGVITKPGEELPAQYAEEAMAPAASEPKVGPAVQPISAVSPERPPQVGGVIRAMPAARWLARDKGMDLSAISGTGPGNVIVLRDVLETQERLVAEEPLRVSTLARRVAEKRGIPLAGIEGTGVRGRVMRADVEAAAEGLKVVPAAAKMQLGQVIPMTSVRKTIASRLSQSALTAPHIYFFTDVQMDSLLTLRGEILEDFEGRFGLRPSINDFLIKAVAQTIRDFPMLNATLREDEIHILPEINIGVAVALTDGLIVPAIQRADELGLGDIARLRDDLISRARAGKLTIQEIERGTFTVSSLAQYDITCFTAILNPPQSGILSVGKTQEKLAMREDQVTVQRVCTLGLSVDHRIVDGAVAADFLQNLKWKIERASFSFLHL
jgi:pyruvate dehydrogenase E2 component (dihydrolipoamide acetyltransferase)